MLGYLFSLATGDAREIRYIGLNPAPMQNSFPQLTAGHLLHN